MNEEVNNNVVNNNYEPPKSNNGVKVLLIILILLVLCLIGLTCYKVFVYDKKDNTKPNNNTPVEEKGNNKTNDNTATEEKVSNEEISKFADVFHNLYFDDILQENIIYSDYYDFKSIPNDLKISLAYYGVDKSKDDIKKKDLETSLKKMFGNDIDLLDLKYPDYIGPSSCPYDWIAGEGIYKSVQGCTGQHVYDVNSKIINVSDNGDTLEVYIKYMLQNYAEKDDEGKATKMVFYSDGNRKNKIGEFIVLEKDNDGFYTIPTKESNYLYGEGGIDKLLENGDLYKIVLKKDGDSYHFISMEKEKGNTGAV